MMKKIVFPASTRNIKNQSKELSAVVDRIMSNPNIRNFLQENELDQDAILGNLGVLLRYMEVSKHCDSCESMKECPYNPKGYRMELELVGDRDIRLAYRRCLFQVEVETMNINYWLRDFPEELLKVNLDDVAHTVQREEILNEMLRLLQNESTEGMYLFGDTGIGKSYLVIALCNEFVHRNQSVAFTNTHSIMETLREKVINDKPTFQSIMVQLKNVDILILDDIGGEKITDWSKDDVIYELLNDRYMNHRITLFTSNYRMSELMELYGGDTLKNRRLYSRLKSSAKEYELIGLNYRAIKR